MERCPVCQARLKDEPSCHRCRVDLSNPLQIEARANALQQQTIFLLAGNELDCAFIIIQQAVLLKRDPLSLALLHFTRHLLSKRERACRERFKLPM